MHEHCGIRTGIYDRFHWPQTLFGERIPNKFAIKHLIWDDLIMYAKMAWARVVKLVEISIYLAEALLKGFDDS